jgi:glycine/D-amino acid oxidase-like deaminating enzyme
MTVDVAVVGGGYTGLWTALYVKRARPDWRVVVLEREVAGFGASGRNGGWLSGFLAGNRERWAARHGREAVVAAQRAMFATVGEVAAAGIPCDLVTGGSLTVAVGEPALRRLQEELAYERAWGFGDDDWRGVAPRDLGMQVAGALGGLYSPHCARVQPARLVRGLAALCEAEGVEIFECTPVQAIAPFTASTPAGDVRARWVVRATEGYTARLPGMRRAIVPLNSAMVVTEPLSDAVWDEIGWAGCETLLDGAHAYCYLQRTADGRIAIGGRGVPYRFGSRTDLAGEIAPRTVEELRGRLVRLFPVLRDVRIADAWAGVLGVSRDWCPSVGADPRRGLAWAGGYVGDGVSTANLAGRTLRDLVTGERTELTALPWVNWGTRAWETEPLRYAGIRGIYKLYRAADAAEERSGKPSRLAAVAGRIAGR